MHKTEHLCQLAQRLVLKQFWRFAWIVERSTLWAVIEFYGTAAYFVPSQRISCHRFDPGFLRTDSGTLYTGMGRDSYSCVYYNTILLPAQFPMCRSLRSLDRRKGEEVDSQSQSHRRPPSRHVSARRREYDPGDSSRVSIINAIMFAATPATTTAACVSLTSSLAARRRRARSNPTTTTQCRQDDYYDCDRTATMCRASCSSSTSSTSSTRMTMRRRNGGGDGVLGRGGFRRRCERMTTGCVSASEGGRRREL